MTANKDFKKLVRQRMQKSGLSYAAARHLLHRQELEQEPVPTRDELYQSMANMQQTIRELLAPIAEETGKPLDPGLVSAVMFDRELSTEGSDDKHWVVHLYSLSPGLVIGREGRTASVLRDELCRVAGDNDLRLNIIDFARIHAEATARIT